MHFEWWGAEPRAGNEKPREQAGEGCPGGWSRCRFAQSFLPYRRELTFTDYGGISGRIDNPRIHHDTPDHILALLNYFELKEMAAVARYNKVKAEHAS